MGKVTNPPLTSGDFEEIKKWEPGRIGDRNRSDSISWIRFPLALLEAGGANKFGIWRDHHILRTGRTERTGMMSEDHTG